MQAVVQVAGMEKTQCVRMFFPNQANDCISPGDSMILNPLATVAPLLSSHLAEYSAGRRATLRPRERTNALYTSSLSHTIMCISVAQRSRHALTERPWFPLPQLSSASCSLHTLPSARTRTLKKASIFGKKKIPFNYL
jgi:hypothetical protein